jgi:hypothetical protein
MRRSMASTLWRFSTTRMLHDYVEKMYLPAAEAAAEPVGGSGAAATEAAAAVAGSARAQGTSSAG